ncbi:MAG: protein kinase [candidate division Zixibacteria bacterium]|nr:protein kinase [candidate division Zixibacteria bacterium]
MTENGDSHTNYGLPWRKGFDPSTLIGWVVGEKYKITRHIKGGGFGEVFEAVNQNLPDQKVVVKFLKYVESRKRFEQEAKILCQLDHPNICRIIDFYSEESALVMQFIHGQDCDKLLSESYPLDDAVILNIACSVTKAIAYAHTKDITHRDLKPKNIMIDHNNHVYLIDFGIAKETGTKGMTLTGAMVGTPEFAAPERLISNVKYDSYLSDIYEIGATLYKLATNYSPLEDFHRDDKENGEGSSGRELSRPFKNILKKATQRNPKDRYKTADILLQDLNKVKYVYRKSPVGKIIFTVLFLGLLATAAYFGKPYLTDTYNNLVSRQSSTLTESLTPVIIDSVVTNSAGITFEKTRKIDSVEKKVPEKPTEAPAETKLSPPIETTPTRPVEILPKLTININPLYNTTLYIDGIERSVGVPVEVKKGGHTVKIINFDYPIYEVTVPVNVDKPLNYDLAKLFQFNRKVDLYIGAWPPSLNNAYLVLKSNGNSNQINNIPFTELKLIAGLWDFDFDVRSTRDKNLEVDSVRIFIQQSDSDEIMRGSKGEIDLNRPEWQNSSTIYFTIFWHEK